MNSLPSQTSKFRLSRRGKKLSVIDDPRTLSALPKEISERSWYEIIFKEDNDLLIFDIREEILETALQIGYDQYMERQNAPFTVFCAAEAWLKLIDWHFYRHDPGEEPSAYPPCFIPKRVESWVADKLPDPSPKDNWCRQEINVVEVVSEETLLRSSSDVSLVYPVIDDIPQEYWFPGKINWPEEEKIPEVITSDSYASYGSGSEIGADSELVQNVTDYSIEDLSKKTSTTSVLKVTTPVEEGSLHGAGDSTVIRERRKIDRRMASKASVGPGRSRGQFPPAARDSRSRVTEISDCRLRTLRLDTQYEISSEKMESPSNEPVKRK